MVVLSNATFPTLRGSLRSLRRVAARALERLAFCATTLRFTSFIFGACVRRAPSEPASVASVVINPFFFQPRNTPKRASRDTEMVSKVRYALFDHILSAIFLDFYLWGCTPDPTAKPHIKPYHNAKVKVI